MYVHEHEDRRKQLHGLGTCKCCCTSTVHTCTRKPVYMSACTVHVQEHVHVHVTVHEHVHGQGNEHEINRVIASKLGLQSN